MFSQSRKSTKLMQFMVRYLQIQRLHAKTFQQLYENNLKPHQPTKAILSVRVQNIKQTVVSDGRQNINKLFLICLHIQCFFCYKFSGKFSNHPKCRLSSQRSSAIRGIWDTDDWYKKLGGNHNILVVVVVVENIGPKIWPKPNIKQDHRRLRYHRRHLDYQSPYFQLKFPLFYH